MKKNPCKNCEHSFKTPNGMAITSYKKECYECSKLKEHRRYLESQRMFTRGKPIKNMEELLKQEYVFLPGGDRAKHIEVVKSFQLRTVIGYMSDSLIYEAIRKE